MNLTLVPCKTEPTFVFALIQRSKEREKKKEEEEKVESVKLLEARLDPRRALTYAGLYWLFSLFFLFSSFFPELDIENQPRGERPICYEIAEKTGGSKVEEKRERANNNGRNNNGRV